MDKELEELMEEFKKVLEKNQKGEKEENIKKAKEEINKRLDKNPDCLLFVIPNGHLATGRADQILSLLAMLINSLKETFEEQDELEAFIYACLSGLCMDDPKKGTFDKDMVNNILEVLKENM